MHQKQKNNYFFPDKKMSVKISTLFTVRLTAENFYRSPHPPTMPEVPMIKWLFTAGSLLLER